MPAKDFYKILDVPITASQEEIKKAYRVLALRYHPDVNAGGKATENWFREIHEAYRILNDPDKRSAYNQERWYRESTVSGKTEPPNTPEQMLQRCMNLARHARSIDTHRTNYQALQQYLLYMLSSENLEMLRQWNSTGINLQIANQLIAASAALSYKRYLPVAENIARLTSAENPSLIISLREKKRESYWKSLQFPVILLASILLCLLIYLAGR